MTKEYSLEELEAIGQKLSSWVESDEYFETLENTQFQGRTSEGVAQAEAIVQAATRGRPSLAAEIDGKSPTINARVTPDLKERLTAYAKERKVKPSVVVREALEQYLPRSA